ncbi:DUF6520 family protein [Flavobacterium sp. 245]|uniref:DUF6520 family protein n=1 Tax=Flavobacterium sp. 245 TaxID=2512115 RepID=UPI00105EFE77|nr:DUF6520 family protein [Flavobacterium sp. 245]TDO96079.1 hypothetical protein EV145_11252 [Flavobacterium sp. 245]
MKTLILKNMVPFAVVVMGISGAFLTTSMQSASRALPIGYTLDAEGDCNIEVNCSTNSNNPKCRQFGATGPQAYEKVGNNCPTELYRPNPN